MFDISSDLAIAKELVIRAMETADISVSDVDKNELTHAAEYLLTRPEFPEMREKLLKELT